MKKFLQDQELYVPPEVTLVYIHKAIHPKTWNDVYKNLAASYKAARKEETEDIKNRRAIIRHNAERYDQLRLFPELTQQSNRDINHLLDPSLVSGSFSMFHKLCR